jgi:hypothetical protein
MVILPFSKKLDALRSVAPFKFRRQDLLDKLDTIMPLLSQAEESRNRIVHATWIEHTGSNTVFFHKPRATRKAGIIAGGIRPAATDEIEAAIKSIDDAMTALCELGHALEQCKLLKTDKMFAAYCAHKKSQPSNVGDGDKSANAT